MKLKIILSVLLLFSLFHLNILTPEYISNPINIK